MSQPAAVVLKPGRERPLLLGHPWIFSGAVSRVIGHAAAGDTVAVQDRDGRVLAWGYYNPKSQIPVRILAWGGDRPADEGELLRERLARAVASRARLGLGEEGTTAYRLVNGEADLLPGLVVDRYGDFLAIQCTTLGMERRRPLILAALTTVLPCRGIVERSEGDARHLEGLAAVREVVWGEAPPPVMEIRENGYVFFVDLLGGHKTGFYLDQRDNRRLVGQRHFAANAEVLNCFAYTGAFSVYLAGGGAGPIVNLDASGPALELAQQAMACNHPDRPADEYLTGNAFQLLRHLRDQGRRFDGVILDPPKLARGRRDLERAARGYKDLNLLALHLLRPGGWLATFSCSGRVSAEFFQKILFGAAVDARRQVQILHHLHQGPDHPVFLAFPESAYLKGFFCRVW